MGNLNKKIQEHPFELGKWFDVAPEINSFFVSENRYSQRSMVNIQNNQIIQQYQVFFMSEEEYQNYIYHLSWRNKVALSANSHIYPIIFYKDLSIIEICSTSYSGLLYIQKVQLIMSQISQIPVSDTLYILKSMTEGFKELYEKIGYFPITQEMVFIDNKGIVKVWINPNLSLNVSCIQPENENYSQGSQSKMLINIIQLAQKNMDKNQLKYTFSQYLIKKSIFERLSFDRILQQIQSYAQALKINIPTFLYQIRSLYQSEDKYAVSQVKIVELKQNNLKKSFNTKTIIEGLKSPTESQLGIQSEKNYKLSWFFRMKSFSNLNITKIQSHNKFAEDIQNKTYLQKQEKKNIKIRKLLNLPILFPHGHQIQQQQAIHIKNNVQQFKKYKNQPTKVKFHYLNFNEQKQKHWKKYSQRRIKQQRKTLNNPNKYSNQAYLNQQQLQISNDQLKDKNINQNVSNKIKKSSIISYQKKYKSTRKKQRLYKEQNRTQLKEDPTYLSTISIDSQINNNISQILQLSSKKSIKMESSIKIPAVQKQYQYIIKPDWQTTIQNTLFSERIASTKSQGIDSDQNKYLRERSSQNTIENHFKKGFQRMIKSHIVQYYDSMNKIVEIDKEIAKDLQSILNNEFHLK